jgi:hypothetical protein
MPHHPTRSHRGLHPQRRIQRHRRIENLYLSPPIPPTSSITNPEFKISPAHLNPPKLCSGSTTSSASSRKPFKAPISSLPPWDVTSLSLISSRGDMRRERGMRLMPATKRREPKTSLWGLLLDGRSSLLGLRRLLMRFLLRRV